MDHTVLPAINTIPAVYLVSVHQMAGWLIKYQDNANVTRNCKQLPIPVLTRPNVG